MKGRLKGLLLCLFLIGSVCSFAQDPYELEKPNANFDLGQKYFEGYGYKIAIKYFKKAYEEDTVSNIIKYRLAQSYYFMRDFADAETWAEELVSSGYTPTNEQIYTYIEILASNRKYDEAIYWYNQLPQSDSLNPRKIRAKMILSAEDFHTVYMQHVKVHPVSFNVEESDFAPYYFQTGIIFTSGRQPNISLKKWFKNDGVDYNTIYYANWQTQTEFDEPEVLSKKVKSSYHEGPACFYDNDTKIMFTKSSINDRKLIGKKKGKGLDGETNLKLYMGDYINGKVTNIREFEYNSENFSTGHPTISADGQRLIFSSNRPDSDGGGTDLYISYRVGEYSWSPPRNLGDKINTSGKELFPFIYGNVLYFASDGHAGQGGLDVFQTTLVDREPTEIVGFGYPINSEFDDFGFCSKDGRSGYLSSNRGHPLNDDIYYVEYRKPLPPKNIKIIAKDSVSKAVLLGSKIRLIDTTQFRDLVPLEIVGDSMFVFLLEDSLSAYRIVANATGYFTRQQTLQVTDSTFNEYVEVYMEPISSKPLELENIYYDFDKAELRDSSRIELNYLIEWLDDNPSVRVEIRAHTDNIGNESYNLKLSQRRAQSVVDYLVDSGIDSTRLVAQGYGETLPVIPCENPGDCTKEDHQKNRRTELVVLKNE